MESTSQKERIKGLIETIDLQITEIKKRKLSLRQKRNHQNSISILTVL